MSGLCPRITENMFGHAHVKVEGLSYLSLWRGLARADTAPGTANVKQLLSSSSFSSKALIVTERRPSLEQCSLVWHHCSLSSFFHLSCFLFLDLLFSFQSWIISSVWPSQPSAPSFSAWATALPLCTYAPNVCVPCWEGLFIMKVFRTPRHLASTIGMTLWVCKHVLAPGSEAPGLWEHAG